MSKQKFKISSALKNLIGKDLITDDFVAIFEIVKNSIDAGAKNVNIYFDLETHSSGKIYIVDSGKGMSKEDFLNKWLFVAYSAKNDGTEDNDKSKIYAGNKGVGRFSCDRLGKILQIQSRKKDQTNVTCLKIDWNDFEIDQNIEFDEINVDISTIENYNFAFKGLNTYKHGVIIEISELREKDSWTRDKLLKLKWHLQKLINPFKKQANQIKIKLFCPRESIEDNKIKKSENYDSATIVNGNIESFLFNVLYNKTTYINSSIKNSVISTSLIDRGELIYEIEESISPKLSILNNLNCNIELYHLNHRAKINFNKIMGISALDYGSIFLFKNNYRIFPVGEPGIDSWGIDYRKQQGYNRYIGTRDVIGQVEIFGNNKGFSEPSSRDKGFINTPESNALKLFLYNVIKKLEAYTVKILWKDEEDKDYVTVERLFDDENRFKIMKLVSQLASNKNITLKNYNNNIISILDKKSKEFDNSLKMLKKISSNYNDKTLKKAIANASKVLKESKETALKAINTAEKEREAKEKAELEALQSQEEARNTKQAYKEEQKRAFFLESNMSFDKEILESFTHQIQFYASRVQQTITNEITRFEMGFKADYERFLETLGEISTDNNKIFSLASFATSANFRLGSEQITTDICSFIIGYLNSIYDAFINEIKIEYNINSCELEMSFLPIEIGVIIDNLISNAIKANASKILFNFNNTDSELLLIVSNNGLPIDKSIIDKNRIFEKGVTRTTGSGLGLYYCKKHLASMNSNIILLHDGCDEDVAFEIRIPK